MAINCTKLADLDTFTKSDPRCDVYAQADGEEDWVLYHKTEQIDNDLNPKFKERMIFDVNFDLEKLPNLRFEVFH